MDLAGLPGSPSCPAQLDPRKVRGHNVQFASLYVDAHAHECGWDFKLRQTNLQDIKVRKGKNNKS